MGAGHDHAPANLADQHRGRLWIALSLTSLVMVVQIIGGWLTNSLALLSDAAHMGTDVLGVAMALAAITAVRRSRARPHRTFGLYRLEVLSALANTVLLFGAAAWITVEAVRRFTAPPEVDGLPMLAVAFVGLIANVVSLLILRSGAKESINVRGAYFEVLGDALGSLGVIAAGVIILTTGWWYADPVFAVAVAVMILPRAWRLGRDALRILLQTAPAGMNPTEVTTALKSVDGVTDVHDLHLWTLTSGMDVASAHLTIAPRADVAEVLAAARQRLRTDFNIEHATLQVEPAEAPDTCRIPDW